MKPFRVDVGDSVLSDLQERLARARFPVDLGNEGWNYGVNADYLRSLVTHWRNGYDWRLHEKAINALPQFVTDVAGQPIHFVHVRGKGPNAVPIILSHGWPWTFWDMRKLIGPLTDPVAHGGSAEDAFDVIIPSLPGFGFSPLKRTGINFWSTADLWVDLMEQLGYHRFAAFGSDWGALITSQLGHKYADRIIGIHLTLTMPLTTFTAPLPGPEYYGEGEAGWHERTAHFFAAESGYSSIQATKPQTLAYGLNDSPIGQCAWLLEKRRSWSDCDGDVERVFDKDDLLTTAMIYWITQTSGSSGRYYYECVNRPWQPSHNRTRVVDAPTTVSAFDRDITLFPRRWAEQYYNLKKWNSYPQGGHFAPVEQPDIIVDDLRSAFRDSRS